MKPHYGKLKYTKKKKRKMQNKNVVIEFGSIEVHTNILHQLLFTNT